MNKKYLIGLIIVALFLLIISICFAVLTDRITNGDFATGDLTGWTVYATNQYSVPIPDVNWTVQTNYTNGTTYAAQAGPITGGQMTFITQNVTVTTNPANLTFTWKSSCEGNYWDGGIFCNGTGTCDDSFYQDRITGETDWTTISYMLPVGTHTLRWAYYKDDFGSQRNDTIWLYNVSVIEDVPAPPTPFASDSLVAHWKLDGNALDSAGSNDGTVHGATVTNQGRFKQAYDFDGVTDYIRVEHDMGVVDDFTMSVWFKEDVHKAAFMLSATTVYNFNFWVYSGYLRFGIYGNGNLQSGLLDVDRWYHAGVTRLRNKTTLYLDGKPVAETTTDINESVNLKNIFIGRYGWADREFNGVIDEIRIYDRGLTADEMLELYNESKISNRFVIKGSPGAT